MSGRAATTTHRGSYDRLGEAHEAVRAWCREQGHSPAGPVWEVYGHWTDNVEELQTVIFSLLT